MFKHIRVAIGAWFRSKLTTIIIVGLIVAILGYIFLSAEQQKGDLGTYSPQKAAAFIQGLKLTTGDPAGEKMNFAGTDWIQVAESADASLWLDPVIGKIALKRGGDAWLSNPGAEQLAKDQTKGLGQTNLQSPFIFRFLEKDKQNETAGNTIEHKAQISWKTLEFGIGVTYHMADLGITVYTEYTLDDGQLVVNIPELGIYEDKENRLVSLDVLPFFGAAMNGPDGYMLVPDGPGGIIRFNKEHLDQIVPYRFPIYGDDPAAILANAKWERTDIAYPVFGMNREENGFITIVEQGATKTSVVATPAGLSTGFNQVNPRITLRRYYEQPVGLSQSRNVYESRLNIEPFTARYIPLMQGQADYVGMAKAYRSYLTDKAGVKPLGTSAGAPPIFLNVLLSTSEQTPSGEKVVKVSSLSQVGDMVQALKKDGVTQMQVGLEGWQHGGVPGALPSRFPVESAIGGKKDMIKLSAALKAEHIPLRLDDKLYYAGDQLNSSFSSRQDAIRNISGSTVKSEFHTGDNDNKAHFFYFISPQIMLNKILSKALKGWEELDVSGIGLQEMGGLLYSDFKPDHYTTRETSIKVYQQIMDSIKKDIGSVTSSGFEDWQGGSGGGFAYALGYVDHMFHFPLEYNYDLIIDEQVPFYPIAVHGLVTYSGQAGNLRRNPEVDRLREIEYGAIPAYLVTNEDPGQLGRTNFPWLYSSKFSQLKPQIVQEYKQQMEVASDVWGSFIENHRKLAEGVYETTYSGGRRIWVNYKDQPFKQDGFVVKELSYAVIDKGGAQ
ncbi:DUF5696 domain-containing protein [Paenibacillus eucommiae]|uniref:Uncharacterized protein n=1 Tax=Paenibacillus eucommiae TaxID=1355755 RepID=A0ABS4IPQ6_9BACL|nr:DUF5696 domain-containing protein [Paenibacillus eucommiae]MBP1988604.1 hypothetical protein [Paenibacillus eucommiae]